MNFQAFLDFCANRNKPILLDPLGSTLLSSSNIAVILRHCSRAGTLQLIDTDCTLCNTLLYLFVLFWRCSCFSLFFECTLSALNLAERSLWKITDRLNGLRDTRLIRLKPCFGIFNLFVEFINILDSRVRTLKSLFFFLFKVVYLFLQRFNLIFSLLSIERDDRLELLSCCLKKCY